MGPRRLGHVGLLRWQQIESSQVADLLSDASINTVAHVVIGL